MRQAAVCVRQIHRRMYGGGTLQPQPAGAAVPRPCTPLPPGQQAPQTTAFPSVQRGERGDAGRRLRRGGAHTKHDNSEQVRRGNIYVLFKLTQLYLKVSTCIRLKLLVAGLTGARESILVNNRRIRSVRPRTFRLTIRLCRIDLF